MTGSQDCPCRKKNCPRHGDCCSCRAYHASSKRKRPTACERKKTLFFRLWKPQKGGKADEV